MLLYLSFLATSYVLADFQHCTYYISVHVCMQCCKVINLMLSTAKFMHSGIDWKCKH